VTEFEAQPLWRKSSRSGTTSDTNCVELAGLATTVGVRDSKNPHGPILTLSRESATRLFTQIKQGHLHR
jgi:hypothetical protein